MLKAKATRSRFLIGVLMGAMLSVTLALAAGAFLIRRQKPNPSPLLNPSPFLTEGFDFDPLRGADIEWRGPDIGEKIDLSRLKTKEGRTLARVVDKGPIVLVSVNPACPMCRKATDEMNDLREKLTGMKLGYYVVCFESETPHFDFFKYSASLNVNAPSFLWNADGGPPPSSLFKMTNPSHLLLDSDGTVIRVWPGSYADKEVRDRMARQIIADTLVATETRSALMKVKATK